MAKKLTTSCCGPQHAIFIQIFDCRSHEKCFPNYPIQMKLDTIKKITSSLVLNIWGVWNWCFTSSEMKNTNGRLFESAADIILKISMLLSVFKLLASSVSVKPFYFVNIFRSVWFSIRMLFPFFLTCSYFLLQIVFKISWIWVFLVY